MSLTRNAVRELDRRAVEEFGIPSIVLMENAGRGASETLYQLNPHRLRVAIVCGPGNNGGDGLVMARHLDRLGVMTHTWLCADPNQLSPDAATNFHVVQRMNLPLRISTHIELSSFGGFGWVIDALFGTGLTRPIAWPYDAIVQAINESPAQILAVDIPSGLDCDSGQPLGPTVKAHHTVTFVGMKAGFMSPEARKYVGTIHFADIGAPRCLVDEYLRMAD